MAYPSRLLAIASAEGQGCLALPVSLVALSLGVILLGAELFTNGIEWFGRRLRLSDGAIGSVLAAVGTALPETMIPVIAIFGGDTEEHVSIAIGAILGAPLMLSTLAFFVTGLSVLVFARRREAGKRMTVDPAVLGRDLRSFIAAFAIAILAILVPPGAARHAVAVVLIGLYAFYIYRTFRHHSPEEREETLTPLRFQSKVLIPSKLAIAGQVLFALGCIIAGAHIFVHYLSAIAVATGVPALVLSVIVAPIATELPEKFNSILWVRQGKDTLAMGNISGAMVFQGSIPPALGISFTHWQLSADAIAGAVIAVSAATLACVELAFRRRVSPYSLLGGAVFYAAFLVYIFAIAPPSAGALPAGH